MRHLLLPSPFWRKCSQQQRYSGCDAPSLWKAVRKSIAMYSPSASSILQREGAESDFQHGGLRRHTTITIGEHYQLYRHGVTKFIQSSEFKTGKKYWMAQNSWTREQFQWLLQKKPLSKTDTSQLELWDSLRGKWIEVLSSNNNNNDSNIDDKAGVEIQRKKLRKSLISHITTQRNALQDYIFKHSPMSESLSSPVLLSPPPNPRFVIHTLVDYCCASYKNTSWWWR